MEIIALKLTSPPTQGVRALETTFKTQEKTISSKPDKKSELELEAFKMGAEAKVEPKITHVDAVGTDKYLHKKFKKIATTVTALPQENSPPAGTALNGFKLKEMLCAVPRNGEPPSVENKLPDSGDPALEPTGAAAQNGRRKKRKCKTPPRITEAASPDTKPEEPVKTIYKPKFHTVVPSVTATSPRSSENNSWPFPGPAAKNSTSTTFSETPPTFSTGSSPTPTPSPEFLQRHISKLISQNQAIVETMDPFWPKKYMQQRSLSKDSSTSSLSSSSSPGLELRARPLISRTPSSTSLTSQTLTSLPQPSPGPLLGKTPLVNSYQPETARLGFLSLLQPEELAKVQDKKKTAVTTLKSLEELSKSPMRPNAVQVFAGQVQAVTSNVQVISEEVVHLPATDTTISSVPRLIPLVRVESSDDRLGINKPKKPRLSVDLTPSPPPNGLTLVTKIKMTSAPENLTTSPDQKRTKFLRPTSLPLKPGTFAMKKAALLGNSVLPLVSPETPRSSKSYGQLYLNGNAYTYLGLKCSTRVFYCTLNKPQPIYVPLSTLSMYSNWKICSEADPNPFGLNPGKAMSLYDSRHRQSSFTVAHSKNEDIVTHSSYWFNQSKAKCSDNDKIGVLVSKSVESPRELEHPNTVKESARTEDVGLIVSSKASHYYFPSLRDKPEVPVEEDSSSQDEENSTTPNGPIDLSRNKNRNCNDNLRKLSTSSLPPRLSISTPSTLVSEILTSASEPVLLLATLCSSMEKLPVTTSSVDPTEEAAMLQAYLKEKAVQDLRMKQFQYQNVLNHKAPSNKGKLLVPTSESAENNVKLPSTLNFEPARPEGRKSPRLVVSQEPVRRVDGFCEIKSKPLNESLNSHQKMVLENAMPSAENTTERVKEINSVAKENALDILAQTASDAKKSSEMPNTPSPSKLIMPKKLKAEFKPPTSGPSANYVSVLEDGRSMCVICNKIFSKPSQLRLHLNIHYFERPFRCESCAVSFRTKGHLQKHQRSVSHTNKVSMNSTFGAATSSNPRPFKCDDCKIAFRIHGHLAKHLRSKMHIMKLECLGKLPFGTYAEIERSGINMNDIDTTDCENFLESLQVIIT